MIVIQVFNNSNGKLLLEYNSNVIPRVRESISWSNKIGFVKEVIHNIDNVKGKGDSPGCIFIYIEGIEEF